jgi:hypothetical protein
MRADRFREAALNPEARVSDRLSAISQMTESEPELAKAVLLDLGARRAESEDVLSAVGSALARLSHSGAVHIGEFDLRNLRRTAYEAFCEWSPEP